ncbi:MAG: SHOCT domain-containing protein [Colwellia sp.]|nr:SHOCT domain-containing protein [Colwellia sp.]
MLQSLVFLGLFALPFLSHASTKYKTHQIANLKHNMVVDPQWLLPIANPNDKQQFYLADKSGKIYLAEDGELRSQLLLDLSTVNNADAPHEVALTSFVLHPDFAFRDQAGYGKFYTAHVGKRSVERKTKRLQVRQENIEYHFDAVITEWQFNPINHEIIEPSSQREILRISIVDSVNHIKQLAFNPFKKSWNDDYGLLYFSLLPEKSLKSLPLYSGTILRIKPERFGRKNYTVPTNNPFLKDSEINDEIILLGAQNIRTFIWPQKNNEKLSVLHHYNNQEILSVAELRSDWRTTAPQHHISFVNTINNIVLYQGRVLSSLRKNLLFLQNKNQQWSLHSLLLSDKNDVQPQIETILDVPKNSNLVIFTDTFNELLLLDQNNSLIYRITQENSAAAGTEVTQQESSVGLAAITFLLIIFIIFFFVRSKNARKGLSSLVQRSYAHMEVSQSKQQIGLYRRHQTTTETILNITDLQSSKINLNDVVISTINKESGLGFSDAQELDLRENFAREYKDKMIDDKVRQISLTLNDSKQDYSISLYARKGNQRVTKKRYKDVIEELVDWCWLIARSINGQNTGQRTPRPTLKSTAPKPTNDGGTQTNKKANNQEAINKVIAKMSSKTQTAQKNDLLVNTNPRRPLSDVSNHNGMIDAELVNALDKLVKLKQQGFLTDDEFTKAKEKLLRNLIN